MPAIVVNGTSGPDFLQSVPQVYDTVSGDYLDVYEIFNAYSANDTVYVESGDTVYGGPGEDTLIGVSFGLPVVLFGGSGNDSLVSREGSSIMHGGGGNDAFRLFYAGYTEIYGGEGDDITRGGFEDSGNSYIEGNSGNDTLYGSFYSNTILGGTGNDSINGADYVDDSEIIAEAGGADSLSGGSGNDTIDGSYGQDTIHGDSGDDQIEGGLASDLIYGDSGNDTITDAGGLADTLYGGSGNDYVSVASGGLSYDRNGEDVPGAPLLYGNAGNDTLIGSVSNDSIYGNDDHDLIAGNAGDDSIHAGSGNDTISGDAGNDTINGSSGNDTLVYDLSGAPGDHDVYNGGTQADVLQLLLTASQQSTYAADIAAAQDAATNIGQGTFLGLEFFSIEHIDVVTI